MSEPFEREGGCLCGRVRYHLSQPPVASVHCHCSLCRKAGGTAFASISVVRKKYVQVLAGQEEVRTYRSSPGFERTFCGQCGSTLWVFEDWNPKGLSMPMGGFYENPGQRPGSHIFVGSKAPWHEIHDQLEQHPAWPAGLGPAVHPQQAETPDATDG